MKKNIIIAALLFSGSALASCTQMVNGLVKASVDEVMNYDYEDSEERGPVVERTVKVGSFDELDLSGCVELIYTQGSDTKVTLRGNEKDLKKYEARVKDGKLKIGMKQRSNSINRNSPRLTATVVAPTLKGIDVSGACSLQMPGKVNLDDELDIDVSGAVTMKATDLHVDKLDMDVSGAGDIDLGRLVARQDVDIDVSGAGNVKGSIKARDIEVGLSGSGDVKLAVDCNDLSCGVSGAGDLTFSGKCRTFSKSKSGMASVKTKGLKVTRK